MVQLSLAAGIAQLPGGRTVRKMEIFFLTRSVSSGSMTRHSIAKKPGALTMKQRYMRSGYIDCIVNPSCARRTQVVFVRLSEGEGKGWLWVLGQGLSSAVLGLGLRLCLALVSAQMVAQRMPCVLRDV